MNGEIKIFESPEFGQIRTVMDKKGEPWFCLTDVCKVLGLTQRHVRERLEKGVVSTDPLSTRGGTQMANFVNEDGLYDVILDSSRVVDATANKRFRWLILVKNSEVFLTSIST